MGAVPQRVIGRYALFGEIAAGGMATVHLGRMIGPAGFSRVVAMKRMHPQFAKDPQFVTMFLDEARLAARVRHPNVVSSTDVVAEDGELFIVMEYVEGESLSGLLRLARERGARPPVPVGATIMVQALHGLHAAHEAKSESGMPLGIVHRDVSPQNILVGSDGLARVVDFGIARAAGRAQQHTRVGVVKGKAAYMAPEQIRGEPLDRRVDVYAASVVFWELLTGERLFAAEDAHQAVDKVLRIGVKDGPSGFNPQVPSALDAVVLRGAARARDDRFATALELADAIEKSVPLASQRSVGKWVESAAAPEIEDRARLVSFSEGGSAPASPVDPVESAPRSAPALVIPKATAPPRDVGDPPPIEATRSVVARVVIPPISSPDDSAHREQEANESTSVVVPRPSVRSPVLIVTAATTAAVVLATGAIFFFAMRTSAAPPSSALEVPSVANAPPAASAPPPETTETSVPTPRTSGPPSTPASVEPDPVRPTATASTAPPARSDRCDPPYYYEQGFKRFKPGCL
jgi:serine/threonine-protein kinase